MLEAFYLSMPPDCFALEVDTSRPSTLRRNARSLCASDANVMGWGFSKLYPHLWTLLVLLFHICLQYLLYLSSASKSSQSHNSTIHLRNSSK